MESIEFRKKLRKAFAESTVNIRRILHKRDYEALANVLAKYDELSTKRDFAGEERVELDLMYAGDSDGLTRFRERISERAALAKEFRSMGRDDVFSKKKPPVAIDYLMRHGDIFGA